MLKTLGIVAGGVFVGAIAVEIIRRQCPGALDKVYAKTREITSEAKESFKRGFYNATRGKEVPTRA